MDILLRELFSFPLIVYTFPLLIIVPFWLIASLGMIDLEILDVGDGDIDADGESFFGDWLNKLGLDGVPLTVAITFLDVYGLAFTYVGKKFFNSFLDPILTATAAGATIALVSLLLAIPASAICIKPLRRFFATHEGVRKDSLIGTVCTVTTGSVTDTFGQATTDDGMVLTIRATFPNEISKGTRVVLLEYHPENDWYSVVTHEELMRSSSI